MRVTPLIICELKTKPHDLDQIDPGEIGPVKIGEFSTNVKRGFDFITNFIQFCDIVNLKI